MRDTPPETHPIALDGPAPIEAAAGSTGFRETIIKTAARGGAT